MGVSPNFTFQQGGIGETIQQGVAGLIHAIQAKKQLDTQEQEMLQQQREFELRQEQQKQNAMLGQEQIAQMRFNQKQRGLEFKQQQELLSKRRTGLEFYNQWVGTGARWEDLGKVMAKIDDPDVQDYFNERVMTQMQMAAAKRQADPPPRQPASPSFQAIGMTPEGQPLVLNARTGEVTTGDGQMVPKGRSVTATEQRTRMLMLGARQSNERIKRMVEQGYSPRQENPIAQGLRAIRWDGMARALGSEKAKLFYNDALNVVTNYLYVASGAQANSQEIENQAKQTTADILDSPLTFEQKMQLLNEKVLTMEVGAGTMTLEQAENAMRADFGLVPKQVTVDRYNGAQQDPAWAEFMNSRGRP